MQPCVPWDFKPAGAISEQVRHDKIARQDFYRTASTVHQFYTGIESANPNQRASKTANPPRKLHAVVADYDLKIPELRWREVVAAMKIKPGYAERSLGGNLRLVWLLARPIPLDSNTFAIFVLTEVRNWLMLDLLPGLDAPALTDPTRLYCNGASWVPLDNPPVSENAVQAFFVQCGRKFSFKDTVAESAAPLDVIERAIVARYPGFTWPGEFAVESVGPTFWVPDSTSPASAIIKPNGIFTFSAHADKPFYSWADILGPEFETNFANDAIAAATKDTHFDGKLYWKMNAAEGRYVSLSREAMTIHLKVNCRVSARPDKTGSTMLDRCLSHIHDYERVDGGAPILFQPVGKLNFCGFTIVNTAPKANVVLPSGVTGPTPLLDGLLDGLFDPPSQREPFLAWLQYFYLGALHQKPGPGQNIFLAGGPGVGKTLLNRQIIGGLLGGHTDAARFMLGDAAFNSALFQSAVWSVDDETISDSESAHRKFSSYIKLCAANQTFEYRKKFENSIMVPWSGRVVVTLNLDDSSSRSLPALDGSLMDKVSFFRCVARPAMTFPKRDELRATLAAELPHFAQWLLDWKTPAELLGDSRYGVRPHHEPSLLDKAHQSGKSAPFKELLIEFLTSFFAENKSATEWQGSITAIMRAVSANPMNESSFRSLRLDQVNRHLESLSKEGVLECSSRNGAHKTRVWVFPRFV